MRDFANNVESHLVCFKKAGVIWKFLGVVGRWWEGDRRAIYVPWSVGVAAGVAGDGRGQLGVTRGKPATQIQIENPSELEFSRYRIFLYDSVYFYCLNRTHRIYLIFLYFLVVKIHIYHLNSTWHLNLSIYDVIRTFQSLETYFKISNFYYCPECYLEI